MGFDFPNHLWFLALIAPVVVFYFLKLRRPKREIPSLLLWSRVVNDQRVNSPFQKFKRHLLLLLQILLLAALVLAAAAPFIFGNHSKAKRVPIILDISASMAAVDPDTGKSRFEKAREAITKMIEGKKTETEFALISFADMARSECGFTNNARVLLDALDRLAPKDTPAAIGDAIRIALAMARDHHFKEAELFSDGNFRPPTNIDLTFKLNYHKITDDAKNIGITALSAKRSGDGGWTVFAEISGTGGNIPAMLALRSGGETIGEEPCSSNDGEPAKIEFSVPGKSANDLEMVLKPGQDDALASDDKAYLSLPETRPLVMAVSPALPAAAIAARGISDVLLSPWKEGAPPPDAADAAIVDAPIDIQSAKVVVVFGAVPKDLTGVLAIAPKNETVIDWRKEAPLFRHANLAEITLLDGGGYVGNATEKDIENMGYEVIAYGDSGPLVLRRDGESTQYYFLFKLQRSTLPYRVAFPIIMKNICDIAREKAGLADIEAKRTGVLPDFRLAPDTEYSIISPNGPRRSEKAGNDGLLCGVPAPRTGLYRVAKSGETAAEAGVSLLDRYETSLAGLDKIPFNEIEVVAAVEKTSATKAIWRYLAFAALAALFLEWWLFNQGNRGLRRTTGGNKNK